MVRKIEAMYLYYGKQEGHACRECFNFVRVWYHGRVLGYCESYVLTYSEASDWAGKWTACGQFNQPFREWERPLIEVLKSGRRAREDTPIAGQITFADGKETE
ncbi:hypothetical protein [Anaerotruncus massiliensis (ex Togo et al. 2019)]|uniref:hypothetical protein n=1 Tax=Anaerotruncus massiliensis (ex Togo et al. 2019) TaxID=1673720 RepID=UPI0023F12F37|nr:hypothetical protein [Anaerotruncus massiliensis (ex Togo et al. 2019)]